MRSKFLSSGVKAILLLGIIFCFSFLCPQKTFAQTTVNFSLVILPTPEVKQKVIPEKVEKIEEKEIKTTPTEKAKKHEESLKSSNQQMSGFGMFLQEISNTDKKPEISLNNDASEKQTKEVSHFEINSETVSENTRAGPS